MARGRPPQLIDRVVIGPGGWGRGAALFIFARMKLTQFSTVQTHLQFPFVFLVRVPKVREAVRRWEVFKLI